MVTDDETPVAAGETGGQGDELAGGRAPPDADSPADLDAIVSGALTVLVRAEPQDLYLPELAPSDQERVDSFAKRGRAAATLQSYKSDWDLFIAWCLERRYRPLPASPATVAAFLGAPQGLSYGQRQSEQMVNKSLSVAAKYIKFRGFVRLDELEVTGSPLVMFHPRSS